MPDYETIDLEGNEQVINNNEAQEEEKNDITGNEPKKEEEDITGKDNSENKEPETNPNENHNEENEDDDVDSSTGELQPGDSFEYDNTVYTVDENGNIVDDKGNIFKEAKDVKEWLKTVVNEEDAEQSEFSLAKVQENIGIDIVDEEGNKIEFTNDVKGISSYIQSVIDVKTKETQEATLNRLFTDNPILKQFMDYCQLNGSPVGFGQIPDRSKINLDKDNIAQQVYIIKMAAQEFGNASLSDNYINYLKDSGGLYDEAKQQLDRLIEKDKNYMQNIEREAEEKRKQDEADLISYWKKVNKTIESRNIAGYKLPESFTKEIDGKKVILTPNDFFDYLSKANVTDAEGNRITAYVRDLNNITDEEAMNKELLNAWLMFTGGTYKDLINMAINEDKVRKLRMKSKETRSIKPIRFINKTKSDKKVKADDIVLI